MKIRSGFVSNSSSSSFLIYGICVSREDAKKRIEQYGTEQQNKDIIEWDVVEALLGYGLTIENPFGDSWEIFIGKSWGGVKDDQTGAEFKAEVESLVENLLGPGLKFGTHEYAWRDG